MSVGHKGGTFPWEHRGCKQHSANAEQIRGVTKDADGDAGKQHEQQLRLFLPAREEVKYSKSNKIKHAATMDAPLFSANVFYPFFPGGNEDFCKSIGKADNLGYISV